jgi:hypothetical protein
VALKSGLHVTVVDLNKEVHARPRHLATAIVQYASMVLHSRRLRARWFGYHDRDVRLLVHSGFGGGCVHHVDR